MNAISNNRPAACVMENLEGRQFFSTTSTPGNPAIPMTSVTEVEYAPYCPQMTMARASMASHTVGHVTRNE